MSCLKNPKKWLWFKWDGDHNYKPASVNVFITYGEIFEVVEYCENCGARQVRSFVKWEDLLEMGMTNEEIEQVHQSRFKTHYFPAE